MKRILVADDHTIVREGLKQILAKSGDLQVAGEAANGNDVLKLVREQEWDVLVTDMVMPGMEMMGEVSDRSGDTREARRGEPAPAALPRCRGGLRGIAERAAGLCQ